MRVKTASVGYLYRPSETHSSATSGPVLVVAAVNGSLGQSSPQDLYDVSGEVKNH